MEHLLVKTSLLNFNTRNGLPIFVSVSVSDEDGMPVRGLRASEFQVYTPALHAGHCPLRDFIEYGPGLYRFQIAHNGRQFIGQGESPVAVVVKQGRFVGQHAASLAL